VGIAEAAAVAVEAVGPAVVAASELVEVGMTALESNLAAARNEYALVPAGLAAWVA